MHLPPLIQDLAIILACAAAVAVVFHRFKQPLVVGYLLAGALVGPNTPFAWSPVRDLPNIRVWAEIGVIFLMFHLGLEFSFSRFRRLGITIVAIGLLEVSLMLALGWGFASLFHFERTESLFIAAIAAISSTTIIVKALDELGLKTRRFAETIYGVLIVEDLLAVFLIVLLTATASGRELAGSTLLTLGLDLAAVIGGWFVLGALLVPRFIRHVSHTENNELMTLLAIGLCLGCAVLAAKFHYSMALGAFIMGALIGETKESPRVIRLIHPMRDLFAAIFFISIGMLADLRSLGATAPLVFTLIALVIFGKFVAVFGSSLLMGKSIDVSSRAALSMGQIGEFSFIIASLGILSGKVRPEFQSVVVSASVVTSFTTPYLIRWSEPMAKSIEQTLPERWKRSLDDYSTWATGQTSGRFFPLWIRPGAGKLLLNGLIVGVIFAVNGRWISPLLTANIEDPLLARSAAFCSALMLSGPFLYAMAISCHGFKRDSQRSLTPSESPKEFTLRKFTFRSLTVFWIGLLSAQYLSAFASASITLALISILACLFYRRLEHSYSWLEGRFLSGLHPNEDESPTQRAMRVLAPWDAHLVKVVVHPNSPLMGVPLEKTGLRKSFGLLVIAIRRGDLIIALPSGTELLLPKDELLVLGTDEQIETARPHLESAAKRESDKALDLGDYDMKTVRVEPLSRFAGKTVQASRVREEEGCVIVGVERNGRRWLAPHPELRLEPGDFIWVAGPRPQLERIDQT